jgi:hypothetical protein
VDALRLVLSDDAVAESGARKKVEDSISVGALSLLVAEAFRSRIPLHPAVKSGTGRDIDSIITNDVALCDRKGSDWERESVRRTSGQVCLGCVWVAFDLVLTLVDSNCLNQRWGDRGDGGYGVKMT